MSPANSIKKGHSAYNLFKNLLDPQSVTTLNATIQKSDIKSVIYSENATINIEEHAPYNRLFRPRDFSFIRYVIKSIDNEFFMIDKSIEQDMLLPRKNMVRGSLCNKVRVSQNIHQIMLVMDLNFQNKGSSDQQ